MEDEILLGILAASIGLLLILFLISILLFILQAIGLFKMAKREGRGDIAWLAWIPIISQFLMTLLVEKDVHPGLRGKFTLLYGIAIVLSFVLSSFIFIVSFIPLLMMLYAFYFIAAKYSPNPVLHLVIGIITIGFSIPISIFIFRNREIIDKQEVIL